LQRIIHAGQDAREHAIENREFDELRWGTAIRHRDGQVTLESDPWPV
jgi:hypothetical protein